MGADEVEERLKAVQETLTASVEELFASDDWRAALAAAAKFHNYSFDNVLLIYAQHQAAFQAGNVTAPEPSLVAGFRQWQAMGRQVQGGQHGYKILRPNRVQWRETKDPASGEWRRMARTERLRPGASVRQRSRPNPNRPFDLATVFDLSQTAGEPIPQPPAPLLLAGRAPDGLWEGLAEQVVAQGFALRDAASATVQGAGKRSKPCQYGSVQAFPCTSLPGIVLVAWRHGLGLEESSRTIRGALSIRLMARRLLTIHRRRRSSRRPAAASRMRIVTTRNGAPRPS